MPAKSPAPDHHLEHDDTSEHDDATSEHAAPTAEYDDPAHDDPTPERERYAVYYSKVTFVDEFLPMEKAGRVYFAPLTNPIRIQTPVLLLDSELDTSATLGIPSGSFVRFLQRAEHFVVEAAASHRSKWFRKPLSDDALRDSFKSFLSHNGVLRVKVSDEFTAFDEEGDYLEAEELDAPVGVRCILELDGVCFGKKEFGAMWTLTQAQIAPAPRCMIERSAFTPHDEFA